MKWMKLAGVVVAGVATFAACSGQEEVIERNSAVRTRQEAITGGRRLIGYVPEWNSVTTPPAPENLPWNRLTHINVAFAGIKVESGTYKCAWMTDYQQADSESLAAPEYNVNVPKLISYRNANHPGVKVLLSVGGWTLSYRFSTAVTDAKRAAFVSSCVAMMKQYGFDGLDFDWEYPGDLGPDSGDGSCKSGETCQRSDDHTKLTALFADLRGHADMSGKLITAAIRANTAGDPANKSYDYIGINNYLDFVNVMTYDKYGTWESNTNRSAPIQWSKDAVAYVANQGVTASKVVMGVPFYGPGWSGVNSSAQAVSGNAYQVISYKDAKEKFLNACPSICSVGSSGFDKWIWCNGTCNGVNKPWISYDDASTVDAKMDYIAANNYGGGMYWMEGQDSVDSELVSTMYTALDTTGSCTGSCTRGDGTTKQCGDNGCGTSCGTCGTGTTCNANNQCVTEGGGDGDTGGGGCSAPKFDPTVSYVNGYKVSHDNKEYTCVYVIGCPAGYTPPFANIWSTGTSCGSCTASCTGKQCGPNGCGGSCGSCASGEVCDGAGLCKAVCQPNCDSKSCGSNGCGGDCGTCSAGKTCSAAGQCVSSCTANCTGKSCGSDGCDGVCGTCSSGQSCSTTGQCVSTCTPSCSGKVCGQDGCGGVCGTCASGSACNGSGQCVSASGACSSTPDWTVTSYAAGAEVKTGASGAQKKYKCKPAPFNGWCGIGDAYKPGYGFAWRDAWDEIGTCQ